MKKTKKTHQHTVSDYLDSAVPTASQDARIQDIEKQLIEDAKQYDTLDYIYIVDKKNTLVGVLSVLEVFRHPKKTPIADIMHRDLITVPPQTHPETAAHLAIEHTITAVPVVEQSGKFLGIISHNTLLHILHTRAGANLFRFSSVRNSQGVIDNVLQLTLFQSFKHRFPWLLIGLVGGMVAAKIVGAFDATLEEHIILAAFIPLIVYMADAAQTQMETFLIRDEAISSTFNFKKYFLKQCSVVVLIGSVSAVCLGAFSLIFHNNIAISAVLALSLFAATISSLFTGLIIPHAMNRLHADPANASGPLATILQDIISVLIYFSIATWLL